MTSTAAAVTEYAIDPLPVRQAKYAACIAGIQKVVANPAKQVVVQAKKLARFGVDESSRDPVLPAAAVLPSSVEEVAAVVRVCAAHKVPMTPRGAGTGLEGGAIPYAGGIVIDTTGLRKIEVDMENACVWVGAGVKKLALSRAAKEKGLHFGPDPASNPSVGGMVATSGSGMSTLRYGTTRENVISLRVVTPEGHVVQTRQVVRKSSAGLELTQLYIGSEGTLGIVCEVCFRLFPATKYAAGGIAAFEKLGDAVRAVVALRQRGVPQTLLRCELMNNKEIVASTNTYGKMSLPEMAIVLLEFTGNDWWLSDIKRDYKYVEKIFKEVGKARTVRYLRPGKEMDDVWTARRSCYFATMHSRGKLEKVFGTDVCVPISKLTDIVEFTEAEFAKVGRKCLICAHISDGNFHLNIPFSDKKEMAELRVLETKMIKRAIELGGTISGEHGIGVGKVHVVCEHGQCHIDVQEAIKAALDKDNLMNPGAFYPCQQRLYPTAHL
ncbi:D-lactate dehydrogenase-like protein [Novymonas esmeraldas]|uniref:D-lactate dehydrogenase (cytochrome) n=1 Tax=Novymonas esmeraldas TaxID=1808958 RepID=A0AAW0ERZ5_9TRYP